MSHLDDTIWCAGCGTEICWGSYVINNQDFCCQDCALGFSCKCSKTTELEDEYRDAATPQESIHPGD